MQNQQTFCDKAALPHIKACGAGSPSFLDTARKPSYRNPKMIRQALGVVVIATICAASDCYFPFLEFTGVRSTCGSSSDCGPNANCIYSLDLMRRVCCSPKAGTVAPKCPAGYDGSKLNLPILCTPNDDHLGDCPDEYECVKSETEYTIDLSVDGPQYNFMCCKKE